jgi:hypothetical protein
VGDVKPWGQKADVVAGSWSTGAGFSLEVIVCLETWQRAIEPFTLKWLFYIM